jgi:biotin carboxyl carrier protein
VKKLPRLKVNHTNWKYSRQHSQNFFSSWSKIPSLGLTTENELQEIGLYKSHMSGKVAKICVKIGDSVKKGKQLS